MVDGAFTPKAKSEVVRVGSSLNNINDVLIMNKHTHTLHSPTHTNGIAAASSSIKVGFLL
jgi:hypothetical protein